MRYLLLLSLMVSPVYAAGLAHVTWLKLPTERDMQPPVPLRRVELKTLQIRQLACDDYSSVVNTFPDIDLQQAFYLDESRKKFGWGTTSILDYICVEMRVMDTDMRKSRYSVVFKMPAYGSPKPVQCLER